MMLSLNSYTCISKLLLSFRVKVCLFIWEKYFLYTKGKQLKKKKKESIPPQNISLLHTQESPNSLSQPCTTNVRSGSFKMKILRVELTAGLSIPSPSSCPQIALKCWCREARVAFRASPFIFCLNVFLLNVTAVRVFSAGVQEGSEVSY